MTPNEKDLLDPPAQFRAKPFWALNGKLDKENLKFQIACMKKMGFGGAFLHSRTNLLTEYLSDEWMELIAYAADEMARNGMQAYLYDEDRWPSGTCGGMVSEKRENRAKSMIYEIVSDGYTIPERFLGLFAVVLRDGAVSSFRKVRAVSDRKKGETLLSFRWIEMLPDSFYNGFTYIDTMVRAAAECFIALTHEKYRAAMGDKFGKELAGIFTDEPHRGPFLNGFARKEEQRLIEIPYTPSLFEEFLKRKGYDLQDRLPVLWFGRDGEEFCKETYDLIEVEQELFLENFAEPIGAWCRENKLILTGHVLHEDNLAAQTTMCGSVMRYYEYMDYPGMDNLTECNYCYNVPKLVSSAARQLKKPFVLDELYAATGWKMRLCDYKRTGDWQSAGGVTLRCPHLSWYTMKGEAKRDYPASILHQSAWYPDYRLVEDYFARLGYLLSCGKSVTDAAVVNPVESTWGLTNQYTYRDYFQTQDPLYAKLERDYSALYRELVLNGTEIDYLDEGLFSGHGSVKGGVLSCGEADYRTVVLYGNLNLRKTTFNALCELIAGGGTVIVAGGLPRYLDGVPHDYSAELQGALFCGDDPASVRELLKEREELRISAPLIVSRRKLDDGDWLVFLLNPPEEEERTMRVEIVTDLAPLKLDLRTGERKAIAYRRENGAVVLERSFARDEECMLLLTRTVPSEEVPMYGSEVAFPQEFSYELDEPNFLVLDRAEYAIDGVPQGEDYVLNIDGILRDCFGLERRGNEMIQPWFKKRTDPDYLTKKYCRLTLKFNFYAEAVLPVSIMGEELGRAEIFLNGEKVCVTGLKTTPIDSCFRIAEIGQIRTGRNEISLSFDFYESTDVEGCFLCGPFGVRAENDAIMPLPEFLRVGDIRTQGLPYYGGRIRYTAPLENGSYCVQSEELICACAYANGKPIVFPPFMAEFEVTDGMLEIETVMTRNNLFGCTDETGAHSRLLPQGCPPMKLKRKNA